MTYQHTYLDGTQIPLPIGKVVCVGRNYVAHIQELNNPIPEQPLLFIKPSTSLVTITQPIQLPTHGQCCHHELELALLIGTTLCQARVEDCQEAIIGYGLALDLTLRDVQEELKKQGHPWEIAKGFDNACPISPFLPMTHPDQLHNIELKLTVNNQVRQHGNTQQMLMKVPELLAYMSRFFTLLAGEVVLTGTPAGVGELHRGDKLWLELESRYQFATVVV